MPRRGPGGLIGLLGPFLSSRGAGRAARLGGGCFTLLAIGAVVVGLIVVLGSCGGSVGLPGAAGRYPLKERSVTYDGDRYSFLWADPSGNLQRATTGDVRLQLDEQNLLEVDDAGDAILHLRQDEPITVEGRDGQGDFGSFWYPFLAGQVLGGGPVVVNPSPPREYREPVYRRPPSDSFDRGDTLTGSRASTRPNASDDDLEPIGGAVSGQSRGTGGGQAATNRAESATAVSGQRGGTGSGSAVINKSGGLKRGDRSYAARVDAGELKPISGRTEPRVGAGSGAPSVDAATSKPRIGTGKGSAPPSRASSPAKSSSSTPRISTKPRG
jgi:hypothetical protein